MVTQDELLQALTAQGQKTFEDSELNRMFGRAGKYYDRVVGEQTGLDPENLQTSRDYLGFLSPALEGPAVVADAIGGLLAAGSSFVGDTVGNISQGIYPENSPMRMTDNDINSLRKTGAAFATEYIPTPMGINQASRINFNNYQPIKDGKFNLNLGDADNLTPNNFDNMPPGGFDNLTNAVVKQNQIDAIGPQIDNAPIQLGNTAVDTLDTKLLADNTPTNPLKIDNPVAATNDASLLNAVVQQTDEYKERLAAEGLDSRHNLDVQRMNRIVGRGRITAPEKIVLGNNAPAIKLARDTKSRFPENDGWAKLEVAKVKSNKPTFKEIPYTFHQNTKGKAPKKNTPEREGLVNNITNNVVNDVALIRTRAEQGDSAAQRILSQASWYKIFSTRLRETFGGNADMMADVLGGSSPNTAVAQNWQEAVAAIEQYDRGEFDTAIDAWIKHREAGGTITTYQGPRILRDNGKNFGTDAKVGLMMDAFAGTFRNVKEGDAPKARNFSGNLAGTTNAATIDVWAARFLNRMADKKRVPTVAEAGVKGKFAAGAETVGDASTGQFGFGQDVFKKAADELNMSPDDLQAVVWFAEKEHWTKNNWTSVAGEGGSVEQQLDNAMMVNHQIGMTTEGAVPLSPETMKVGMDAMEDVLRQDGVVVHSNRPTIGLYGDGQEASYDIEWTTRPGYDGLDNVIERLAEVSKASEQKDAFISKVLTPAQAATNPNTRFGVEIAFKKPMTAKEIKPLVQFAEQNNVYGATLITGGNREDASSGAYRGIRFQANPEMAARFNYNGERELFASNPDAVYDWMEQQMPNLEMVRDKAGEFGNIANSRISFYDTLTIGQESYDDFIRGKNASGTVGTARFGQPLSSHVRNRLETLKRNPEGNRVGNLYRINSAGEEVINPSNLKDPSLDDPYRVRGSIRDDLLRQFELLEKNNGS